jgi:uncharacterized membrane protein YbjE (DUF340 family)
MKLRACSKIGSFDQETFNQQRTDINNLVELYCDVDDFYKVFIPQWQQQLLDDGTQKRRRDGRLTTSEVMTIVIGFHMSHSMHRSMNGCMLNLLVGLVGYCLKKDKSSLNLTGVKRDSMVIA